MFERIRASYVEKPDDAKLMEGAINGMISSLDPHSRYMNEKGWSDMQETTHGEFGGLGIEVTMEDGLVKVVAPIDDTPAAKAGIMSGDVITQIDDEPIARADAGSGRGQDEGRAQHQDPSEDHAQGCGRADRCRDRARGHPGAAGALPHRGRRHRLYPHHRFNEQTTDGLRKAIAEISKEIPPDKLAGYVVDLRNNPGGLLDQAVSVSSTFMARGEVVSTRGRTPEETQRFTARGGDLTKGKPLVVLINGGSASASEIVAGALHDHKRATIIGTRSFGKGSVQTIIPLGAGNGALALTTARYFTPSGKSIQAQGITPDIEVLQDVPDELKTRAETARARRRCAAIWRPKAPSRPARKPTCRRTEKDDKALHAAFNLLRGVTVNADAPASAKRPVPN